MRVAARLIKSAFSTGGVASEEEMMFASAPMPGPSRLFAPLQPPCDPLIFDAPPMGHAMHANGEITSRN
jgi:hypothetical protein